MAVESDVGVRVAVEIAVGVLVDERAGVDVG
jgi:hypothetical protein